MGGSSPPFLYAPPSAYSFNGPTDRPFNPKAVTHASRTRPVPKQKPKGPLISFNRHPDAFPVFPDGVSRWTPMSPKTKGRVFYGRKIQLALRVLGLLGALGSLFCAIVVKNIAPTMVWIIRAGPAVGILHTLYGIHHLLRSPIGRPTGSQASYMVFSATLDLGLVPFYVFTAFIAYKEYTADSYHWATMFSNPELTQPIAKTAFILSLVNGGFHAICFAISVSLAIIFHHISQLPPDLNPLEDNLTARPHKRTKSELAEKHMSQSSVDTAEDPLISSPRTVPFMHTRAKSSEGGSSNYSDIVNEQRLSQGSLYRGHLSYGEPPRLPEIPSHLQGFRETQFLPRISAQETGNAGMQAPSTLSHNSPVREPSPDMPSRSHCLSPDSDNWVLYPSRSPSPLVVEKTHNENLARGPSSVYTGSEISATSGGKDWLSSAQLYGGNVGEPIAEDIRGEYESIAMQEYYANDDDAHDLAPHNGLYGSTEQDLGDQHIKIFQDHDDDHMNDAHDSLPFNPLQLNPPTPQPILTEQHEGTPNAGRRVLSNIPNLAPTPTPPPSKPEMDSPEKNGRFYGDLEGNAGLTIPRAVSGNNESSKGGMGRKKSKLVKRKSQKKNAYGALRQDDVNSDDDGENTTPPTPPANPARTEGDRKGRVVSNSGADYARHNNNNTGVGSGLSSYGSYIAGLGVGRRRDVSGKVAEEGRSGAKPDDPQPHTTPTRAAGWARFAGL